MSNIGIIDENKLFFKNSVVDNCLITGMIKNSPYFQLAICTFKNTINMNAAVNGSKSDRNLITNFLNDIHEEIISNIK